MSNTALTLKTSLLLDELEKCIKWVEKKTINESLQGFLFELDDGKLSVSATDGLSTDITTVIPVESSGSVRMCVPAHQLERFVLEVSKLSGEITLSFGKKLVVKTDRHRTEIVPFNDSMFPTMFRDRGENNVVIYPEEFARAVKLTAGVSDPKSPFPALGGIYFSGDDAVSTDGVRMCILSGIHLSDESILLDGTVCSKIGQAISDQESVLLSTDSGRAVFYWDSGIISVTRMIGNFPKYQALMRDGSETTIRVDRGELASAVRMGSGYAFESHNLVIVEATGGELVIRTVSMTGSHKSVLNSEEFNGPDKKIGLSIKYLLDATSKIDSNTVVIGINSDKDIVLLGNGTDYTYGIMPMYVS